MTATVYTDPTPKPATQEELLTPGALIPIGATQQLSGGNLFSSFSETHLSLLPDVAYERYEAAVKQAEMMEKGSPWWLGDLAEQGDIIFGEMSAQAFTQSPKTILNYRLVCRKFPAPRRNLAGGKFSLYETVSGMTPTEQEKWLKEAEIEDYTRADLRKAIQRQAETGLLPSGENTREGNEQTRNLAPPHSDEGAPGLDMGAAPTGGQTTRADRDAAGGARAAEDAGTDPPIDRSGAWLVVPAATMDMLNALTEKYNSRTNAGYTTLDYLAFLLTRECNVLEIPVADAPAAPTAGAKAVNAATKPTKTRQNGKKADTPQVTTALMDPASPTATPPTKKAANARKKKAANAEADPAALVNSFMDAPSAADPADDGPGLPFGGDEPKETPDPWEGEDTEAKPFVNVGEVEQGTLGGGGY